MKFLIVFSFPWLLLAMDHFALACALRPAQNAALKDPRSKWLCHESFHSIVADISFHWFVALIIDMLLNIYVLYKSLLIFSVTIFWNQAYSIDKPLDQLKRQIRDSYRQLLFRTASKRRKRCTGLLGRIDIHATRTHYLSQRTLLINNACNTFLQVLLIMHLVFVKQDAWPTPPVHSVCPLQKLLNIFFGNAHVGSIFVILLLFYSYFFPDWGPFGRPVTYCTLRLDS